MNKGIVIALILLAAIAAGVFYVLQPVDSPAPETTPEPNAAATTQDAAPDGKAASPPKPSATPGSEPQAAAEPEQANTPEPPAQPKGFCERDFDDIDARQADVSELQAQGGLVHIFEQEARLADPYGCADFYLEQGLNIDAVDPRENGDQLTGLFFAIQRNDPQMVNFMIDHGADLKKRAGKNDTRAMGYAYYLALNDQRIDRNEVIGLLDTALTEQAGENDDGS